MGQLWQWHLPQESSPFFSWAGLFLFWGCWPLSGLLLERAPKCFLFHCSQHPALPSSCEDAKDFLLNTSAVRTGMGTLSQLNPSPLCAQAPRLPHVPEFHHNISKLFSTFTSSPSTVTFNAALSAGNGDVLWSPILYVTSSRGSFLPFFTPYLLPLNRDSSVEIIRIFIPS